jgi:hypothetical protein
MNLDYRRMTDFLIGLGIERVGHTNKTYLAHLVGVYRLMHDLGCSEEVCRAGMFHSIYGTQQFQGFKLGLDQPAMVRDLIGERAERLAYMNCAMDRASFDIALNSAAEPYRFGDRITGEAIELSQHDFDDLCAVHLYDWLEQAPRSRLGWDYRHAAYQRMAERLGEIALAARARVFARQAVSTGAVQ